MFLLPIPVITFPIWTTARASNDTRYGIISVIVIVIILAVALLLALWIETAAMRFEPSFLLLTKQAHKDKEEVLKKKYHRSWFSFAAGIVSSLVLNIIANIIFAWWFV